MTVRTIQRGYVDGKKRPAGQVRRVHVVREEGPGDWEPGKQTMCGQAAWTCYKSSPIVRDAPHALPPGLEWCPRCVGLLAERLGKLAGMASALGLA